MNTEYIAYRGECIRFSGNPFQDQQALEYITDALLIIENGRYTYVGDYHSGKHRLATLKISATKISGLICPGFVDLHCHYPQIDIIGSYGKQLLDWLNDYTFPAELAFADPTHCQATAKKFISSCLRNGVTTAAVYCTVHPQSAAALFEESLTRNMRMIAGKVLMNRNAPTDLCDTVQSGYDDSEALINRYHQKQRLSYAVTPRFAPTSSNEQLESCGALLQKHPSVYCQTHVAENKDEVAWVAELFPQSSSYLSVYRDFNLLTPKTILGHAIYFNEQDWSLAKEHQITLAHCPSSNLFIGSGLFDMGTAITHQPEITTGLASDIGGGTNLCPLATMNEAYKVSQLQSNSLTAAQCFWLQTTGAAQALSLHDNIGNIEEGLEADFIVLRANDSQDIQQRLASAESIEEKLFVMIMMGDNRLIDATYIMGQRQHSYQIENYAHHNSSR